MPSKSAIVIEKVTTSAYRIPTDDAESDGTYEWDSTTLVLVEVRANGRHGVGYTYADGATARLIHDQLAPLLNGMDAMAVPAAWLAMVHSIRNLGRPGIASMAIAAVDAALWDLKAKLLDLPLAKLLGIARDAVPLYGSGGFTSYSIKQLQDQLSRWVECGMRRVKMKVGREPAQDLQRVRAARDAIGPDVELFVDANGAYSRKQALRHAEHFAELKVAWFEEPVSSDDLEGMRLLRDCGPAGINIAAGEYGYDQSYFRRMLEAGAVDVLQADASRCAGVTGFLQVDALCGAFGIPLSAHTAPALHVHACCSAICLAHLEYFHDHARIEQMLFEGAIAPVEGQLRPDMARPGIGLEFKRADAQKFAI